MQEVELFELRIGSTKPYDDRGGTGINRAHEGNLMAAFLGIKLIDADSINPEVAGGTSCVDLQKSVVKVLTDGKYLAIAEYCARGRFPIFYYWIVGAIVREWVAPCV